MPKSRTPPPLPTALERCEEQMRGALEAFEDVMRQKAVVEAFEQRVDFARDFVLAADHLRMAKLLLLDGLRRAALAVAPAEGSS